MSVRSNKTCRCSRTLQLGCVTIVKGQLDQRAADKINFRLVSLDLDQSAFFISLLRFAVSSPLMLLLMPVDPATFPVHQLSKIYSMSYLKLVSRALDLQSICALFLCMMRTHPGGCNQASPSTCTGTHSSPRMLIWTARHWAMRCFWRLMRREAAICAEPKTATTWNSSENLYLFYIHDQNIYFVREGLSY